MNQYYRKGDELLLTFDLDYPGMIYILYTWGIYCYTHKKMNINYFKKR